MSLHALQKLPFARKLLLAAAAPRAAESVAHFAADLKPGEKILDIGSGICDITSLLAREHEVTALDVEDFSCLPDIRPVIYDGRTIPFADQSFDTALLLTVLHHTANPGQVLQEALRVARRVIITEDVYYNSAHKYATFLMDSLLNLEFRGHPHSNKTDGEWRQLFGKFGVTVTGQKSMKSFLVLRHRMYVLEST